MVHGPFFAFHQPNSQSNSFIRTAPDHDDVLGFGGVIHSEPNVAQGIFFTEETPPKSRQETSKQNENRSNVPQVRILPPNAFDLLC